MAIIDNPMLGFVTSLALPAAGAFFKNPIYGALGGLVGGALYGLQNDHTGWNLVSDIALGAAGGGFGGRIGRKGTEEWILDGKAGKTVGEQLSKFTRLDRAIVTSNSMGAASALSTPPLLIKDMLTTPGMLPTVSIGRGDP
ncbi:hypothetical protein AB0H42_25400 [Nocardia sp. NPDC050799]|uniref:hypothetical protein n=1 Tax=Nocardia sp. NPDC050799 TaxID=3154842 RepID=UPI00340034E6